MSNTFLWLLKTLYNTGVEYHSPLAAEPLPSIHKPAHFLQGPVTQRHLITVRSPPSMILQEHNKGPGITYGTFRLYCCCDGFRLLFAVMCHASSLFS